MRKLALGLVAFACLAAPPQSALADFGFQSLSVGFADSGGKAVRQAGSHPFEMTTTFDVETKEDPVYGSIPDGEARNLTVELPPGFIGDPYAVPRCSAVDFLTLPRPTVRPSCDDAAAVGVASVKAEFAAIPPSAQKYFFHVPVFNLQPDDGAPAKLGFNVLGVPVTMDVGVSTVPPYETVAKLRNISQALLFYGTRFTLWGNPADPAHDALRGECVENENAFEEPVSRGMCEGPEAHRPFLVMPRRCAGPLDSDFGIEAWNTGARDEMTATSPGMEDCSALDLKLNWVSGRTTSASASAASGLEFSFDLDDPGLRREDGRGGSDIKRATVVMPRGMTANPSVANGLHTCSAEDLEEETLDSEAGEGCPQSSKLGTVEVESPLLEGQKIGGEVFIADQDDNPFGTLLALYMVVRDRDLGILIKLAGKVVPDRDTGQLVTTFDGLPQIPLGHVTVKLRGGPRGPLITPPKCGEYDIGARFVPWANPERVVSRAAHFRVTSGPGGSSCPSGEPFEPGFSAGSADGRAGAYSPFLMRLTRRDGDQDIRRFSAVLPRGMLAKLAGVSRCSEAALAEAGHHSGREEMRSPACPANSRIGSTLAGAGVGSELTYVPGDLYLAGPLNGAPLSVAAITPAVAGPFDVGTVVVREALDVAPKTGQAYAVGAPQAQIPNFLEGIPLKLRDLRVNIDRPDFTVNPTSCAPKEVEGRLIGSAGGSKTLVDPFQADRCRALGFSPRLAMRLLGGIRRGQNPALQAVVRTRPGQANFRRAVVRLPQSAYLEQGHIRTVCTRVQFAADSCPKGAIYGYAKAWTPLLGQPLRGPVYLRSSDNLLPDLVADLRGVVDIELSARIDSVKGGIRATFAGIPDAPVSVFVMKMLGGKRSLIVNSRNLCASKARVNARFAAQNGRGKGLRPVLHAVRCERKARKRRRARSRGRAGRAGAARADAGAPEPAR